MYATGCFLAKNVVALPRYAVPSTGTKREYEVEINPGKPNSRKVPAKLVGMSSPSVMVLHVQGENLPNPIPLSDIAMADSGDPVTVYGLSFAEPGTGGAQSVKATLGRSVSSTSRMMILTMASRSIVPGGPIVNAEGKLVGFASRNSSASSSNPNLYMMPASSIADVIAKIPDLRELQTAKESAVVVVAAAGLNKTVLGTGTVVQPGYVVTCAQKLTDNWATLGQGRATYEIHASVEDQAQHDSYGSLLPTPDGKMVFALGRLLTPDGKPIGEVKPRSSIYIPAVQGTAWLSLDGGDDRFGGRPAQRPRLHIHLDRDTRPIVTINEPTGLENLASADQRIFLVQDAKLMAIVPPSGDKLVLHRFDIDAMLDKAGIDYLLVVGSPPTEAPLGGTFRYTPRVKSKKGGVKIKLDSGPEGMKLGADNTLTWAVPKDAPKEVNVILTISDATGQEVFHTFTLATKTLD